jgi:hypothetical protein
MYKDDAGEVEWSHEIISMINKRLDIDTVILSTYAIGFDELFSNNPFYKNSYKILDDEFKTRKIKASQIEKFSTNRKTSNIILDTSLYRDDLKFVAHHYPYEFDYQKLKAVFFFGKAWDQCIRTRPLGVNFWAEHSPNTTTCFLPRSCRYSNDTYVNFTKFESFQFNEECDCYMTWKMI